MMKQRSIPAVTLASLLGLAACSAEEPLPPPAAVRPVKTLLIDAPDAGGTRTFPGRIAAARRAELAFRVPGKLQEIPVVEGQEVKQGDLVAGLDPTDYQITFNDRKATFERSRADYERGQKLVEQGTISRRDFDALTANFKSSEAALQQAQQDLIYTKLIAPFDGIIVRRLIDNFEEIPAREPVLVINDISSLEVKIDIPEGLMQRLRRREQGDPGQPEARVFAIFDAAPGQQYPLEFKEVAARADPQTQTFEVTLTMPPPEGLNVLSGMTTSVIVDSPKLRSGRQSFVIPSGAVIGDAKLDPSIWVFDPQSSTVKSRKVRVRTLTGGAIEVLEGLEAGDRVIVAGAAFLAEGMRVRPLPEDEQPENNLR